MSRCLTRIALSTALAITGTIGLASTAKADHHLVMIREVHNGAGANDDYVMLQFYADGQNLLMSHYLSFRSADGSLAGDHLITHDDFYGGNQRTFLIGNSGVPGSDDVGAMDQIVDPSGAACYEESAAGVGGIDCVSWGAFTGSLTPLPSPAGTPAAAIGAAQSLIRTEARSCP